MHLVFIDVTHMNMARHTRGHTCECGLSHFGRYGLSFVLINPIKGQDSVHPAIVGQSGFAYAQTFLSRGLGNTSPLLVCNVTRAFIAQDDSGQGQVNILTVVFSSTIVLFSTVPPNRITLFGLTGTASTSSQNLAISGSNYKNATFDHLTGILILSVKADLAANVEHSFSFSLTNPTQYRDSANVSMASSFFFERPMTPGHGIEGPLRVIGLLVSHIAQSIASASAFNFLTITLQGSETITAQHKNVSTVIVIEGLTGTDTVDSLALPLIDISGQAHSIFGSSCSWQQASGTLLLTMLHDALPRQDIVFSITLLNPSTPKSASTPTIQTSQGLRIAPQLMSTAQGQAQVLLVAGFTYSFAMQSTPSQSASNTLTISFACNFALIASQNPIVTIDGLTGSTTTGDMYLSLSGGNVSFFGDGTGILHKAFWYNNRQIHFKVETDTLTNKMLWASFILMNPAQGQPSPSLRIRANGVGFTTPWQTVAKAGGNSAPLLVATFSFVSMGQTNGNPGDVNIITVTLATNCDVYSSAQLHIAGMHNASSSTTSVLVVDKANGFASLVGVAGFAKMTPTSETTLNVGLIITLKARVLYAFSFHLTNPLMPQADPDLFLSSSGAVTIGPVAVEQPLGLDAVLRIFSFATVKGNLRGDSTRWSLRSSSMGMAPRRGHGALFLGGLSIEPASAHSVFGFQGQWYQEEGKAVISILAGQIMQRGSSHVISFSLHNAFTARDSSPVYMLAGGKAQIFDEVVDGESRALRLPGSMPGDAQPLKLYSNTWAVVEIGQDNPFPSAVNTIHVTLASWKGLSSGTIIDIWGLLGTITTNDAAMSITNYNQPSPGFLRSGTWVQSNGNLLLTTLALNASTLYHFSFSLTNRPDEQNSPVVSIEARGKISIPAILMNTGSTAFSSKFLAIPYLTIFDAAPLRIRANTFYVKACGQSKAYPVRYFFLVS